MHGRGRLARAAFLVADGDADGSARGLGDSRCGFAVLQYRRRLAQGSRDFFDALEGRPRVATLATRDGTSDAQDNAGILGAVRLGGDNFQRLGGTFARLSADLFRKGLELNQCRMIVERREGASAVETSAEAAIAASMNAPLRTWLLGSRIDIDVAPNESNRILPKQSGRGNGRVT
jgi:hypothetical protein